MVLIVICFACAIRCNMERTHRFAFFLRQVRQYHLFNPHVVVKLLGLQKPSMVGNTDSDSCQWLCVAYLSSQIAIRCHLPSVEGEGQR